MYIYIYTPIKQQKVKKYGIKCIGSRVVARALDDIRTNDTGGYACRDVTTVVGMSPNVLGASAGRSLDVTRIRL